MAASRPVTETAKHLPNRERSHLWWKSWQGDHLMKLVERMPRMYKAVSKAKSGYF
jgi:hypothetical protein